MNEFPRIDFKRSATAPTKKINIEPDIQVFQKSVAFERISIGLFKLCQLCSGKQVPPGVLEYHLVNYQDDQTHENQFQNALYTTDQIVEKYVANKLVIAFLKILEEIRSKIELHPPVENHSRYGNLVFREWFDDLVNDAERLLDIHLTNIVAIGNFDSYKTEAVYYLINAFGSRARIDYGTGHELSFLALFISSVMCLSGPIDLNGTEILILFAKYLDLIRTLILTYKLEPAGSHGVWGLDDHFHLPYILGSSQFVDTLQNKQLTTIKPSSILNNSTVKRCCLNNMFFNSISFIKKIKKGPFNEHSPLLYDISNVKTWLKINQGMIKMYFGEVLGKHPVVQHFWFGTILFPWTDKDGNPLPTSIVTE